MKKTLSIFCILASAVLFMPSANAALITYEAFLTGLNESPPNASPGTGLVNVIIDTGVHTMQVEGSFSGLAGTTTAAHIHAPTAVAGEGNTAIATPGTIPGFPFGVTAGNINHTYDMTLASSYSSSFIANFGGGTILGAEAALLTALAEGKAYFNIHTSFAPGGEIRGFLTPASVPEPSTMILLGSGLVGIVGFSRRRLKK